MYGILVSYVVAGMGISGSQFADAHYASLVTCEHARPGVTRIINEVAQRTAEGAGMRVVTTSKCVPLR